MEHSWSPRSDSDDAASPLSPSAGQPWPPALPSSPRCPKEYRRVRMLLIGSYEGAATGSGAWQVLSRLVAVCNGTVEAVNYLVGVPEDKIEEVTANVDRIQCLLIEESFEIDRLQHQPAMGAAVQGLAAAIGKLYSRLAHPPSPSSSHRAAFSTIHSGVVRLEQAATSLACAMIKARSGESSLPHDRSASASLQLPLVPSLPSGLSSSVPVMVAASEWDDMVPWQAPSLLPSFAPDIASCEGSEHRHSLGAPSSSLSLTPSSPPALESSLSTSTSSRSLSTPPSCTTPTMGVIEALLASDMERCLTMEEAPMEVDFQSVAIPRQFYPRPIATHVKIVPDYLEIVWG